MTAEHPDPLDALKYMFVLIWNATEGIDESEDFRDTLEALVAPFTPVTAAALDNLRYSDGKPISVTTEMEPGRHLQTHFPPPGYPGAWKATDARPDPKSGPTP